MACEIDTFITPTRAEGMGRIRVRGPITNTKRPWKCRDHILTRRGIGGKCHSTAGNELKTAIWDQLEGGGATRPDEKLKVMVKCHLIFVTVVAVVVVGFFLGGCVFLFLRSCFLLYSYRKSTRNNSQKFSCSTSKFSNRWKRAWRRTICPPFYSIRWHSI